MEGSRTEVEANGRRRHVEIGRSLENEKQINKKKENDEFSRSSLRVDRRSADEEIRKR